MADDKKLPEGVTERDDGFYGVEGLPDSQYYADVETAARVARNIKAAKAAGK